MKIAFKEKVLPYIVIVLIALTAGGVIGVTLAYASGSFDTEHTEEGMFKVDSIEDGHKFASGPSFSIAQVRMKVLDKSTNTLVTQDVACGVVDLEVIDVIHEAVDKKLPVKIIYTFRKDRLSGNISGYKINQAELIE